MYCIKYTYIQYNLLCIFCKLHQSQSLLAAVCYGECPLEGFFITAQLHFLQGPTTARVLGTCPVTTGAYVSCNLTHTQVYTHTTTRRQQFPLITVESVTREFESHFVFSMSDVFYRQIQSQQIIIRLFKKIEILHLTNRNNTLIHSIALA